VASKSITLPEFSASGTMITVATRSLAQTAASDANAPPAPRTIGLLGFQAQGFSSIVAPRVVQLSLYTAAGGTAPVTSRIITLQAYNGSVSFGISTRTITLPAFTAVGIP
jgi:hypothetical protein